MLLVLTSLALTALSCSGTHCLAIASDSTVRIWGIYDAEADLRGDEPRPVPGLRGVVHVAAGHGFSVALTSDGAVWTWGKNDMGQLGDWPAGRAPRSDQLVWRKTPGRVPALNDIVQIQAGYSTAFALTRDGRVWGWGNRAHGQLGNGKGVGANYSWAPEEQAQGNTQPFPTLVSGLSGVNTIASRTYHALALMADGTVRAWGMNNTGALGDGTLDPRLEPVTVRGLSNVAAIAAGDGFSLAALADGTVRVWGRNSDGVLLDGTTEGTGPMPMAVPGVRTAADVVAGVGHAMVLLRDGTVRGWGHNGHGEIGDGRAGTKARAVVASRVTGVKRLVAGGYATYAFLADGRLVGWGFIYKIPLFNNKHIATAPVEMTVSGWKRPVAPPAPGGGKSD